MKAPWRTSVLGPMMQGAPRYAVGNTVAVVEDLEEDLRRDIIGEVANDGEGLGEEGGEVEREEIPFDDMQRGVVVVEIGNRLAVDFDGVEINALLVIEIFGEDTHAGTYLEDMGSEPSEAVGYLAGDILVFEEMLTEEFLCSYFHNKGL